MLNKNTTRGLLLTTCVTATMVSAGCRSMPGMKMFARRSEPSAEALAGTGPTTTYPAPPSASATPEAIASVAGGTAQPTLGNKPGAVTAQVAGYNITPGYATPASNDTASANLSAAQANGIYNGASYAPPSSTATKPSGYTFGNSSASPSTSPSFGTSAGPTTANATPPSSFAPANSSYSLPGSIAATKPLTAPSTSYAPPSSLESKPVTAPVAASAPVQASLSSGSGFTLPPGISPATAAITPASVTPASSATTASSYSLPASASPASGSAASASPAFSTAKATSTSTTSTPTTSTPTTSSSYMPGSTGKATGYPSGAESPTTSGSFYR